jgi:hypothetical protein
MYIPTLTRGARPRIENVHCLLLYGLVCGPRRTRLCRLRNDTCVPFPVAWIPHRAQLPGWRLSPCRSDSLHVVNPEVAQLLIGTALWHFATRCLHTVLPADGIAHLSGGSRHGYGYVTCIATPVGSRSRHCTARISHTCACFCDRLHTHRHLPDGWRNWHHNLHLKFVTRLLVW